GPSLHTELAYLVQAGMNRTEAIRAATSAAADALGLRGRGRVVEGARADLLLVDGDPLTDLDALRSPAEVWVAGDRLVPCHLSAERLLTGDVTAEDEGMDLIGAFVGADGFEVVRMPQR